MSGYPFDSVFNFIKFAFSYFGHYGVQLFIFISGYGLMKAYGFKRFSTKVFFIKRLKRIYIVFLLAIIILLIYNNIVFDDQITLLKLKSVFFRLTLLANWIPERVFSLSGPFWFYSMIVQLYICFPLLLYINKKFKYGLWLSLFSSFIFVAILNPFFVSIEMSLYYNFLGHLPVFILGLIVASQEDFKYPKWLIIISFVMFISGQMIESLWYFSQLTFVALSIPLILWFIEKIKIRRILISLIFVGNLSMYLFAIHGFMRKPWVTFSNSTSSATWEYLYFFTFLLIVFVMAIFLRELEKYILRGIDMMAKYLDKFTSINKLK